MNCPVCHSSNHRFIFTSKNRHGRHLISAETFSIHRCANCRAIFPINIKPNKYYYHKYYDHQYYPKINLTTKLLNHISFSQKWRLIQKQKFVVSSILDIGCGQGEFLDFLPPTVKKYGVEINPTAVKICLSKGIDIIGNDVDLLNIKKKFDCITLWHSLEHLADPQKTLRIISRRLNKNGIIIIATPNSSSLGFYLGQSNYFHLDSPRHVFIPNITTLKKLLVAANLRFHCKTNPFFDFPLDLLWSSKKSIFLPLIVLLYPLLKIISPETVVVFAKKED